MRLLPDQQRVLQAGRLPARGVADSGFRKALASPSQVDFTDTPLDEAVRFLSDLHGIPFVTDDAAFKEEDRAKPDAPVSLRLENVPLAAVLQAIEDQVRWVRFVVRDYGILVTTETRMLWLATPQLLR
jgi:hypothetical protein